MRTSPPSEAWIFILALSAMAYLTPCRTQAANLLNVQFTGDLNPGFVRKQGTAAIGQSATDVWNVYSREIDSPFNWRDNGQVTNLVWANGRLSGVNLSVNNAAGLWGTGSTDPMLHTYLYPLGRSGEVTVTLNNLPTGTYRLYFYAHGEPPQENGNISVSAGGKDYGTRATSFDPAWDPGAWVEGDQFVIFDGIQVTLSGDLVIHSQPGVSGLAVVNGLQLEQLVDDIPDSWRQQYFGPGFATDPRAAATADPDADGANNYQEYLAGTNPLDPSSIKTVPLYVSTYAGSIKGDQDGYRTEATFSDITSATYDPAGRLWITEGTVSGYNEAPVGSHRVRRMDLDQVFRTVAGGPEPGLVNGPLDVARFAIANKVAFDRRGNAFIADRGNHQIRKIDPNENVTTFAGSTEGYRDGIGAAAMFDTPIWIASDPADNLYVADFYNLRVRKVTPDGVVTTFAGSTRGSQDGPVATATFNSPNVVALGPDGALFVSDWANGRIRKIKDGIVSTFASGLPYTDGVSVDVKSNVYVVSSGAQFLAKFLPDGTQSWTLPIGQGFADGPVAVAKFSSATGPPVPTPEGNLLVVDWGNNRLRQITVGAPPLISVSPEGGSFSQPVSVTLRTSVSQGVVRYTLNGLDPDFRSLIAAGPISISGTTLLKAQVFVNDVPVSSVISEVFTTPNGRCVPPPDALVAWWPGEGSPQDQVGGHDGTLVGRSLYAPAMVGNGFVFDGTGNCVRIPNAADLSSDQYSVEAWVNPLGQVVDHDGQDLIFGQAFGHAQLMALPGVSGVKVRWQFAKDQTTFAAATSNREIPRNQFTHLVGTWNGVALRLYLNGELETEADVNAVPAPGTCDWFIGGFQDACGYTGQFFNGIIDELSFYRRNLSPGEVQSLFLAGAAGKCKTGGPCASPAAGLSAWWPADGNAADVVAGQDGTLAGGATFAPGMVGQSFQLNGVDGRVKVPASGRLDVGPGAGLTIESWINPEEIQRQDPIVEWNRNGNYGAHFYISVIPPFGGGPGCLFANLVDTAGIEHTITTGPGVIHLNEFQHVAITYDRTSGQTVLFRNGQIVAQQNLGVFIPQTSYDLYVGYRPPGWYGGSLAFTGRIDEVSVYNRPLTAGEISSVFQAGAAGKCHPGPKPGNGYDLGGDWSDSSNPNGPWALRAGSVSLPHVADWNLDIFNPPQPGWAFGDTVPFWFKSSSPPPAAGDDWQTGDVIVHTHAPGTPSGGANGLANVTWTSPINGRVNLTGAVWEARDILSADGGMRGNVWKLYVRDNLLSSGKVAGGDAFSRANPFTFDLGTGGADALRNIPVAMGDVIRLEFVPSSYEGDYVGVKLSLTVAPSTGLLAAWSFEESGGNVAHDYIGGFNGTLSGGARFVPGGVSGGALSLERASDSFVNMGNALGLMDTSFSIVAWVKTNPGDATENLLVVGKHEAFINSGFFLNVNRSGILGEPGKAMLFAGDANTVPVSQTIVNDGKWHQLVGVHELAGKDLIYVDGRAAEGAVPSSSVLPSIAPFLIGGDVDGGQAQGLFTGLIDEIQIYGRALQPEEIASLFNNPTVPVTEAAQVSTLAGSGSAAFADGQGLSASFNAPNAGFVTTDGSAWIADTRNHRIRRVDIRGIL